MKKYVAVCVYTPNERGATGYASDIEMFNSMDDAKDFISERFKCENDYEGDELKFDERRIMDANSGKFHNEARAVYDDYNSGYVKWNVVEFDV